MMRKNIGVITDTAMATIFAEIATGIARAVASVGERVGLTSRAALTGERAGLAASRTAGTDALTGASRGIGQDTSRTLGDVKNPKTVKQPDKTGQSKADRASNGLDLALNALSFGLLGYGVASASGDGGSSSNGGTTPQDSSGSMMSLLSLCISCCCCCCCVIAAVMMMIMMSSE